MNIETARKQLAELEGRLPEVEADYRQAVERLGSKNDEVLELAAARAKVRVDGLRSAIDKQRGEIARLEAAAHQAEVDAARLEVEAIYTGLEIEMLETLRLFVEWEARYPDYIERARKAADLAARYSLADLSAKLSILDYSNPYNVIVATVGSWRTANRNPLYLRVPGLITNLPK